jgi:hypothetical protein
VGVILLLLRDSLGAPYRGWGLRFRNTDGNSVPEATGPEALPRPCILVYSSPVFLACLHRQGRHHFLLPTLPRRDLALYRLFGY